MDRINIKEKFDINDIKKEIEEQIEESGLENIEVFQVPKMDKKKKINVVCNKNLVNCEEIAGDLKIADLENVENIYILSTKQLIDLFIGDENVEYSFHEEGKLAMNRSSDYPDVPRDILVRAEPKVYRKYGINDKSNIYCQLLLSVFHEEAHTSGEMSEEDAENKAEKKLYEIKGYCRR